MNHHEREQRPAGHRWWGTAALVCTALAALVLVVTWDEVLLVVAGEVVLGWALSALLAVAAVVLRRVERGRRRSGARRSGDDGGGASAARSAVLLSWPMTVLLALTGTGAALGAAGDHVFGASYVTLVPVGPQGCRVIVRETSFPFVGSGDVYAVPGGTGVGRRISHYVSDDGYRPASHGTYELVWGGDFGAVVLLGGLDDPVTEQGEGSFPY